MVPYLLRSFKCSIDFVTSWHIAPNRVTMQERGCEMMKSCALLSAVLLLMSTQAPARTWYVVPDTTELASPIHAALDSASYGDTVLVAPDTYHVTDDSETWLQMPPGVALVSEQGPEATVLELCHHPVGVSFYGGEGARLSGFTIRLSDEPGCGVFMGFSYGIYGFNCTDVAASDYIVENFSYGIYVEGTSGEWWKPLFEDCVIRDCSMGIGCFEVAEPGRPYFLRNEISHCVWGCEIRNSSPNFNGNRITFCEDYAMYYYGHCGGSCWRNVIAYNEDYGVCVYSDPPAAAPWFNGGLELEDANDFIGNGSWDIWYAHSSSDALIMALHNYWGADCPSFPTKIYGRVFYSPWVDSTHTLILDAGNCNGATEPCSWSSIKAMYR